MPWMHSGLPANQSLRWLQNLGQQQYYLAALADEVWLDPNGTIWIDGYSNYRHFYREGLDKACR